MFLRRLLCIWIVISFLTSFIIPPPGGYAQTVLNLPTPGTMVSLSSTYTPVLIKGLKINPKNPLAFDFIVETGNDGKALSDRPYLSKESEKLIKYFFAALTLPEQDVWVNLSPYEKDRIIPKSTGDTEMGRDLLAQDYILKQITASLIYPEKSLGKEFWNKIYSESSRRFGTTQIPVNTFNKVWIVAQKATVYETGDTVFVIDSHLKVMLDEDYLALEKHSVKRPNNFDFESSVSLRGARWATKQSFNSDTHALGSQIIREIILPALEKEVNEGKNFAPLRQIFHSLILAKWYKETLKTALLNQVYANKAKVGGLKYKNAGDPQYIYQQYLKAYKKGVFNYIKEDIDQTGRQPIPRKYFSGGFKEAIQLTRENSSNIEPAMLINIHALIVGLLLLVSSKANTVNAARTVPPISEIINTIRQQNGTSEDYWAYGSFDWLDDAKRSFHQEFGDSAHRYFDALGVDIVNQHIMLATQDIDVSAIDKDIARGGPSQNYAIFLDEKGRFYNPADVKDMTRIDILNLYAGRLKVLIFHRDPGHKEHDVQPGDEKDMGLPEGSGGTAGKEKTGLVTAAMTAAKARRLNAALKELTDKIGLPFAIDLTWSTSPEERIRFNPNHTVQKLGTIYHYSFFIGKKASKLDLLQLIQGLFTNNKQEGVLSHIEWLRFKVKVNKIFGGTVQQVDRITTHARMTTLQIALDRLKSEMNLPFDIELVWSQSRTENSLKYSGHSSQMRYGKFTKYTFKMGPQMTKDHFIKDFEGFLRREAANFPNTRVWRQFKKDVNDAAMAETPITDKMSELYQEINSGTDPMETSLADRLGNEHGLLRKDRFKELTVTKISGTYTIESLTKALIEASQTDPARPNAKDPLYGLKLFIAVRTVLFYEFNATDKFPISNYSVEHILIQMLGSESRNFRAFAEQIVKAHPDISLPRALSIVATAHSTYDQLIEVYQEAATTYFTTKNREGHGLSVGNLAPLPDVVTVVEDLKAKSVLTANIDPEVIKNDEFQRMVYAKMQEFYNLSGPPSRLALIWAALNGQLAKAHWHDFEKDLLPNPGKEPLKDRTDRISVFRIFYNILRQPLDAQGAPAITRLDQTFLVRLKGLFSGELSVDKFISASTSKIVPDFLQQVDGADGKKHYWWEQYSQAVREDGFKNEAKPGTYPAAVLASSAVSRPAATTGVAKPANFNIDPTLTPQANFEIFVKHPQGPLAFKEITWSSKNVEDIWLMLNEADQTLAIYQWQMMLEIKISLSGLEDQKLIDAQVRRKVSAAFATLLAMKRAGLPNSNEGWVLKTFRFAANLASTDRIDATLNQLMPTIVESAKQIFAAIQNPAMTTEKTAAGLAAGQLQRLAKAATQHNRSDHHRGDYIGAGGDEHGIAPRGQEGSLPDHSPNDSAQLLPVRGGIDLNTSKIQMSRQGSGMQVQFDPAMVAEFEQGHFDGIKPVITGIKRIGNIYPFLGLKEPV